MRIALFLDVDKTLTTHFIQQECAEMLGCKPEYDALEARFQKEPDYTTTFGDEIVKIFASKGFTEKRAREFAKQVHLQPWTAQLLELPGVDKYLVSSGPSFFVNYLAKKFNIPKEHVCCSTYTFHEETGIIESCQAVGRHDKQMLVDKHRDNYDLTIGVGDSPEHDGLFLSMCTIQLMTVPAREYIHISDLNSVILLVQRLSQALVDLDLEQGPLLPKLRALTFAAWAAVIGTVIGFLAVGLAIGVELGKRGAH